VVDLEGRVALVTGTAAGIGRATALALGRCGAAVVALDVDGQGNDDTATQLRDAGVDVLAAVCDVGDAGAVERIVARVDDRFGRLDVVVNNAAEWLDTSLTGGSYAERCTAFARSHLSCSFGAFHCTAAAVPLMRRRGGDVVNVLTDHVKPGHELNRLPMASGYDASKWGLLRLTEMWAVELAPLGIRVNGLCFGATDTPMLRAVSVPVAEAGMRADDVADAVVNVLAQGQDGPTGRSWLFGLTGQPVARSRAQIAALASGVEDLAAIEG